MAELNTVGLGQHKLKSINVNANLLSTWSKEREAEAERLKRKYIIVVCQCLAGLILIPIAAKFSDRQTFLKGTTSAELTAVNLRFTNLDGRYKSEVPKLEDINSSKNRRLNAIHTLNQFALINNHARGAVAISGIKVDIAGGELVMKLSAKAPSIEANRYFLTKSGADSKVISSVQTSLNTEKFKGQEILRFEYQKKVNISVQ